MTEKNDTPSPVPHVTLVDINAVIALVKDCGEDAQPESEYRLACNDLVEALSEFAPAPVQHKDLREALAPFVQFITHHDGPEGLTPQPSSDSQVLLCPSPGYPKITVGDLRRARAAYEGSDNG